MQPVSVAQPMSQTANNKLWLGVLGPNQRHPQTALCWGQRIHTGRVSAPTHHLSSPLIVGTLCPMTDGEPDSRRGAAEFEFDLATPLFNQIRKTFDSVTPVPLDNEHLRQIEDRPGLYGLHLDGQPVYIGKADDSVLTRLRKHHRTIAGRKNISPEQVEFRCVYLAITWDPFKPETALMKYYRTTEPWGWNEKGFGANDPGRKRDWTHLDEDHWHRRYPLNPEWRCSSIVAGEYGAEQLLSEIGSDVPFWFRYEKTPQAREQYHATTVSVPRNAMSARDLLRLVASTLGHAWQATITPSHMLLYNEQKMEYPFMEVIWPPQNDE